MKNINYTDIPFKKKISLEMFRYFKKFETRKHNLNYLFWECTTRCMLNCRHCGSDCQKFAPSADMPYQDFLKVADIISKEYNPNKIFITITGGEALLRNDLEECGLELYKRGYPWGIVTNAMLLTDERFDSLARAGMHSLSISLDGLRGSHNWLRQNEHSFDKVMNALKCSLKYPKIVCEAITCVTQKNITELHEIKKLLISLGIKRWRIFDIFPKGRAVDNDLLRITSNQLKYVLDFIAETRREGKILLQYACDGFLGNMENVVRSGYMFCRAGINVGSVLADGSISACPSLRADYIQGNIYKDDFLECWNNKFKIMRDRSWMKTGKCANCEVFNWCEGNGLHLRDEKTGELLYCQYEMLK